MATIRLNDTAKVVREVLETNVEARSNDALLQALVVKAYGIKNENNGGQYFDYGWPFSFIMEMVKEKKVPSMESITRTRRKVQENSPELRGDAKVQEYRLNLTEEYIRLSQDNGV